MQSKRFFGMQLLLATLALALLASDALAQRRGLFGRRSSYYDGPIYVQPQGTTTQPVQGQVRQAYYPPGSQPGQAWVEVRVPADNVRIFFDGNPTTQTGLNRLYVTPPLNAQKDNTYEIKATWNDAAGNPVEKTRQVKAVPGTRVLVDFTVEQPANP